MTRTAIPKRLRFEILRRDNYRCRYCGASAPDTKMTIDHVVPVVLGGFSEPSNLVTACDACQSGKTSITPDAPIVENVANDAIKWSQAMALVIAERQQMLSDEDGLLEYFDDQWNQWRTSGGNIITKDPDWQKSILGFLAAGLTLRDLDRFVCLTMERGRGIKSENRWKYFCGCCWQTVHDLQELARQRLAEVD